MVRKTIRIYKFHDVDLFYLAEHYRFNFQKAIYCALREYLKKEVCVIDLPEELEEPINIPKKSICRTLVLQEETDKDLLEFLQKLPKGHVNGIVKNILRFYLCRPLMEPWAREYNQMFLKEKRVIQAADYKKKKSRTVKNKQSSRKINDKSDEKHIFSERKNKNEPVTVLIKSGDVIKKSSPFETNVSKLTPVLAEINSEQQEASNMSEKDMLTNAFSAFFD